MSMDEGHCITNKIVIKEVRVVSFESGNFMTSRADFFMLKFIHIIK
jgi:hypothetical protein